MANRFCAAPTALLLLVLLASQPLGAGLTFVAPPALDLAFLGLRGLFFHFFFWLRDTADIGRVLAGEKATSAGESFQRD